MMMRTTRTRSTGLAAALWAALLLLMPALLTANAATPPPAPPPPAPPPEIQAELDCAVTNHNLAGQWIGEIAIEPMRPFGVVKFTINADRSPEATLTLLMGGMLQQAAERCDVTTLDGETTIDAHFALANRSLALRATLAQDDGQPVLRGEATWSVAGEELAGTFALTKVEPVMLQPRPMAFTGMLRSSGMDVLEVTIALGAADDAKWFGHIDVVAQGLFGYPLTEISVDDGHVTARLPVDATRSALIDARIEDATDDGTPQRLVGTFKQGPALLDMELARDHGYVGGATLNRPQHPTEPFPYELREVTVEHPDGHTLAGTLTLPDAAQWGDGQHPIVITITGSGPQDRDETIFGHKPFLVIADHLTRHGIAVLRCDDRGVGASTGQFDGATSEDLATDVLAQVAFARALGGIDGGRIALLGHSEGGLIAPMVANQVDVAALVLLAAPAVPGAEILVEQLERILRASNASEADVAAARQMQERAMALLREENVDEEALRRLLREQVRMQVLGDAAENDDGASDDAENDTASMIDEQLEQAMQQAASPWMRYFIRYDPRPALEQLAVPSLALFGSLDLQVWHEQNAPVMRAITEPAGDGHAPPIEIRVYDGLNHLFQPATTGSIAEYGRIETTIDEQVLADIAAWLAEQLHVEDIDG